MTIKKYKIFRLPSLCCFLIYLAFSFGPAEAVTREVFLSRLLDARGLNWNAEREKKDGEKNAAVFMLKSGLVTDAVSGLNAQVTRREALRWCIQSLGLSFEAELFSNMNLSSLFRDANSLTAFERGCLFVASRMNPPLLPPVSTSSGPRNFQGGQRLTDKDMNTLLQNVRQAGRGLSLNVTLTPLNGLTLLIHRDGVSTGIPSWRVYADGFENKNSAEAARKFFRAQGFEMSPLQPLYEWFLRTRVMDDYREVRRLTALIKKRGLKFRILPSVSNSVMEIVPRYWVMLTIDPSHWSMAPIVPEEGPRALAPLSQMVRAGGVRAAVNAGFFAVTGKNRGYPIGALRIDGELLNRPYAGRSGLGWNDDDEAMFGVPPETGDAGSGSSWDEMTSVIQAGPLLLDDGQPMRDTEGFNNSFISARHPRSVVGLTAEGRWFFMVVDGRNGLHASGATLSELTELLRSLRVPLALNLDGGGSTEIIVNGKIYNAISEGKERSISYGLGIRPR